MENMPMPRRVPMRPVPSRAGRRVLGLVCALAFSVLCPGAAATADEAGLGRSCHAAADRQPEPVSAPLRCARFAGRPRDGAGLVRSDRLDGYGLTPGRGQLRRGAGPDRRRRPTGRGLPCDTASGRAGSICSRFPPSPIARAGWTGSSRLGMTCFTCPRATGTARRVTASRWSTPTAGEPTTISAKVFLRWGTSTSGWAMRCRIGRCRTTALRSGAVSSCRPAMRVRWRAPAGIRPRSGRRPRARCRDRPARGAGYTARAWARLPERRPAVFRTLAAGSLPSDTLA